MDSLLPYLLIQRSANSAHQLVNLTGLAQTRYPSPLDFMQRHVCAYHDRWDVLPLFDVMHKIIDLQPIHAR